MVKKLRRKFVITAMSALLVIIIALIAVLNISNLYQIEKQTDEMLQILADHDGSFPTPAERNRLESDNGTNLPDEDKKHRPEQNSFLSMLNFSEEIRTQEMPYETRYFTVLLDENGSPETIDTGHIISVTSSEASEYAQEVAGGSHTSGYYSTYRYRIKEYEDGTRLVLFADCSSRFYNAMSLFRNSLLLAALCLIAMFILVYLLSGKAVEPVVESLEKQKQFITDAGHELKTPLSVISANVDVLELDAGENEWTASIRKQIKRMNGLIKNMLTLSRMEEESIHAVFNDLDFSAVVKETAESFAPVAEAAGKRYDQEIEERIHLKGDKNSLTQLVSLLLDNAVKYSSKEGNIRIRLSQDKNIVLEVSNSCEKLPEGNLDRLFDRFYRADTSRSRQSGGYGIGLSVVRAIVNSHGGHIEAKTSGDRTLRFVATFPIKNKAKTGK